MTTGKNYLSLLPYSQKLFMHKAVEQCNFIVAKILQPSRFFLNRPINSTPPLSPMFSQSSVFTDPSYEGRGGGELFCSSEMAFHKTLSILYLQLEDSSALLNSIPFIITPFSLFLAPNVAETVNSIVMSRCYFLKHPFS
jgi:hypothetical protein